MGFLRRDMAESQGPDEKGLYYSKVEQSSAAYYHHP
jgi:hypothetical protein